MKRREPLRLTLGELPFEVLDDGRVLVTLPPTFMPFGCAVQATVVYASLQAFLAANRANQ
ncbi:MAG: hypothetical protein IPJ61_19895 [Tessaracoccus sp.]|uniref:hypothetical protein n=1 Tax=Tessaracoccus sp. TaxID=1971211 RepID=UPI001EB190A8|nr:hypothetical protein [Tessaracoccus sp.]MBK7823249.1 hypothetical protein [Tessaracoccus sp.]